MNYIDKSTHKEEGNAIIDDLLADCWIDEQNQYINADYDNGLCDKRRTAQRDLTHVLLENQQYYCCYCMKLLARDNTTTLEHIVPYSTVKQEEFDTYLVCDELTNNVVCKSAFDRVTKAIPPAKYPHDIAYHNLVASCDSNIHCNHYRSNNFIWPLFYDTEYSYHRRKKRMRISGSPPAGNIRRDMTVSWR